VKKLYQSPLFWLPLLLLIVFVITAFGPAEKVLGNSARIVYLHGAWVWTALAALVAAAVIGLGGLLLRRTLWQRWSRALGWTGLFFWITYLPLSLWAMQTSWNGLFLAEPRWRLALVFSIAGLLLQAGLAVLGRLDWTAMGNIAYCGVLLAALLLTPNVLHPASPVFASNARQIQIFFLLLTGLLFLVAWQVSRLLMRPSEQQTGE
jgi:hypothetical protein